MELGSNNGTEFIQNDEIPDPLKKLARLILRGFYAFDHSLILDILVRNRCIKEEDILSLCKFEKKQLKAILTTLKQEKILKSKVRMENTPGAEADEKGNIAQTKYNYYFINYRAIVNVVKYKLHKMREKIESEERDNSNRASFVCPQCQSSYTDLQVNQLLDITTGRLFCSFCTTEVEEDQSAGPKTDSRTILAKFNMQMANLYDLLRETETTDFTPTMTDPEPTFVRSLHADDDMDEFANTSGGSRTKGAGTDPSRDSWKSGNKGSGFEANVNVEVTIGDQEEKKTDEKVTLLPDFLKYSTVVTEGNEREVRETTFNPINDESEVANLLKFETEMARPVATLAAAAKPSQSQSQGGVGGESSDDEFIDDDEEEILTVQGKEYSFDQIQADQTLVQQMTPGEKSKYTDYVTTHCEF